MLKAHRLLYHSPLGLRVMKRREESYHCLVPSLSSVQRLVFRHSAFGISPALRVLPRHQCFVLTVWCFALSSWG